MKLTTYFVRGLLCIVLFEAAASAQSNCPIVSFPYAKSAALLPNRSTHRVLLKQDDGSYTAFEMSNTSPYSTQRTIPHFDRQLSACTPAATGLFTFTVTSVTQVPSGGYLMTFIDSNGAAHLAVFDSSLNLVEEPNYSGALFADMTGSGKLDAIGTPFVNHNAAISIALHTGSGFGTFLAPVVYPTSFPSIQKILVADVNGDHKPDLVVLAWGQIAVFAGNGDGTLQPINIVAREAISSTTMELADLNGDGILDLIYVTPSPVVTLNASLGVGDGTFLAPVQIPLGLGDSGPLAVGDLNGDGVPDVFTAGWILFGDGKGGFSAPRDIAIPRVSSGNAFITDFDGDGIADVVFGLGNAAIISGDVVSVIFGTGYGNFAAPPVVQVSSALSFSNQTLAMAAADFNGDGNPDLAVAQLDGTVAVLKGAGDGTFQATLQFKFDAVLPYAVVVGDFNGDNNLDFVVVGSGYNPTSTGGIAMVLGNGDGTFQAPIQVDAPLGAFAVAVGDFNGDGKQDLGILISHQAGPVSDRVQVMLGNGDGTFRPGASYEVGPIGTSIVTADFNRDGKADLFVTSNASLMLLTGNGDGTFANPVPVPLTNPPRLGFLQAIATDFNRDGTPDVAITFAGQQGLLIYLSKGDGTFRPPAYYAAEGYTVTSGDLNGDGIPDLVLAGSSTEYLLGNGDGSFKAPVSIPGLAYPLALADLNHDGLLDVAASAGAGIGGFLNISPYIPPLTVVSSAGLRVGPLAPGSVATALGENLFDADAAVTIEDSSGFSAPATLLGVSKSRINFVVPAGLDAGPATMIISGSASTSLSAAIDLAPIVPAIFTANSEGLPAAYVTRASASGATFEPIFVERDGVLVPVPIDVSTTSSEPYLVLSGTSLADFPRVSINGSYQSVSPVLPQLIPGIDQVSIPLQSNLAGSGYTSIYLTVGSLNANTVYVVIK